MFGDKLDENLFTLTPKTASTIRWDAKYQSIRAIYESLDKIIRAFDTIADDNINFDKDSRQQARSISNNIGTFNFITFLVFMKNLMAMTNSVTTQFQAEKLDLMAAGELIISSSN